MYLSGAETVERFRGRGIYQSLQYAMEKGATETYGRLAELLVELAAAASPDR